MSRNLLESMESAGKLLVEGLRSEAFFASPAKLGGKVLCSSHNGALSPLDRVGGKFFRSVGYAHKHLAEGEGVRPRLLTLFNGHDLERWMLKTLVGLIASSDKGWEPPRAWLEILFAAAEFGPGEGLYVKSEVGSKGPAGAGKVAIERLDAEADGRHAGLISHLGGLQLGLAMEPGMFHGVHRPIALRLVHGEREVVQLLGWDSADFDKTITATWEPEVPPGAVVPGT